MERRPAKMYEARKWLEDHVAHRGDDCLPWPFGRDNRQGYGHVGWYFDGRKSQRLVHAAMCELAHGAAPTAKHEAAHSCGNRICVNPKHLSWKTRSENQRDRRSQGTAKTNPWGRISPLTDAQWDEIRGLRGKQTLLATANQYRMSVSTIHRIQNSTGYSARPGTSSAAIARHKKRTPLAVLARAGHR